MRDVVAAGGAFGVEIHSPIEFSTGRLRIDLHCHLFNSLYLPIAGILRSRKVKDPFATILAKVLVKKTAQDPGLDVTELDIDGFVPRSANAASADAPFRLERFTEDAALE